MNIALVHYTHPPTIGGVETVLERHAQLFSDHGHHVRVLCASGKSNDPRVEIRHIAEISATAPLTLASQAEIHEGEPGPLFKELTETLKTQFSRALDGVDLVFVHNLLTMPFNLACTEALRQIAAAQTTTRFLSWIHDLGACNPDYQQPDREPWRLMRKRLSQFEYVAVSNLRKDQFLALTGEGESGECRVISNGIEASNFLNLTPEVARLEASGKILSRELVLLCPARILKRKNLQLALQIVASLKTRGITCACLITGACDPHNRESQAYAESLQQYVAKQELRDEVFFVSELFTVTNPDLVSLYGISDAVLYPSLQEGFGIPLLEAAVHRLPIFCNAIEPLKDLAFKNVTFLDQSAPPNELAEVVHRVIKETATCRKDVLKRFSWQAIYAGQIEPLLRENHNI